MEKSEAGEILFEKMNVQCDFTVKVEVEEISTE
jgi:hypothetical protein